MYEVPQINRGITKGEIIGRTKRSSFKNPGLWVGFIKLPRTKVTKHLGKLGTDYVPQPIRTGWRWSECASQACQTCHPLGQRRYLGTHYLHTYLPTLGTTVFGAFFLHSVVPEKK